MVGPRQRVAPMVGSHVVCCKCVITLVQVLMKIGKVLKKGGETNLDRATLMRFMFMPGQQLVNLFPARRRRPKPAARAESLEWLEDGEREAREMPGLNWDQQGRRQGLRDRERGAKYCMSHEKIGQKLISSPLPRGV